MIQKVLHNKFLLAGLIIILIISLHYAKILSPLEKIICLTLSPFQKVIYVATDELSSELSKIATKRNLALENQELKQKIAQLEQEIARLKVFIEESELLAKQNEYFNSRGFNFVNAEIIAKSYDSNPNLLVINKGTDDNIKDGMAAVIKDGLVVGKIIKTESDKSFLLLLIDNGCKMSAALAGQSKIVGLVEGKHNVSLGLNYILKSAEIKKGDLVVTSGLDDHIPAGLLIGEVESVNDGEGKLFKSANIISSVNFKNLRRVSIITD